MISDELMNKYEVSKVWSTLKKEESILIGYIRAYLGECADGKWVVVIRGNSWEESEMFIKNTRITTTKHIRKRGFFTRMHKIYPKNYKG